MKIYFSGSIRGGRDDQEQYARIIAELKKYGHVLTEHIGNALLTDNGENLPIDQIFERDKVWLGQADCIVAEVSTSSTGVGYELGIAESRGLPVLCLYRNDPIHQLSGMVEGNPKFSIARYDNLVDASIALQRFFKDIDDKTRR
jgi:nucleoside 2-deoxyribosyltransferase